jgi:hypothetical protein
MPSLHGCCARGLDQYAIRDHLAADSCAFSTPLRNVELDLLPPIHDLRDQVVVQLDPAGRVFFAAMSRKLSRQRLCSSDRCPKRPARKPAAHNSLYLLMLPA